MMLEPLTSLMLALKGDTFGEVDYFCSKEV